MYISDHDITFSAQTINCVCNSIRSMFRVLGINNFACGKNNVRTGIWAQPINYLSNILHTHTATYFYHNSQSSVVDPFL